MDRVTEDVPPGHLNIYYELRSLMPCAITPGAFMSLQGEFKCYNFRYMTTDPALNKIHAPTYQTLLHMPTRRFGEHNPQIGLHANIQAFTR
jgi:hypothetical protein